MNESEASSVPSGGASPTANRHAVYSVALGVCAFVCLYLFPFGAFALGVPSITTGIHGRREIAASKGSQTGDSIAVIGLTIGGGALITFLAAEGLGLLGG